MLLVKTNVAPSNIHGVGVFAQQFIAKGTKIWQWHEGFDLRVSPEKIETLPEICREYFLRYSWLENNYFLFCVDNEKFINHSDDPNCIFIEDDVGIANRDIHEGEEITQDYKTFDENFGKKEYGYDWGL